MSNVLVFAEQATKRLHKTTLVAVHASQIIAQTSVGEVHSALLGTGIEGLANELAEYGVKKVYAVEGPALEHYTADAHAQALANLAIDKGCDVVVATASAIGKDLM